MEPDILGIVRLALDDLRPENVDSSAVIVTGEGSEVGIVIVPQRSRWGFAGPVD